ncbi:hypothetical protein PIB30_051030 [Stylosanthes scabra]|uniref:Uncharacterized protein n=1 Tax=Stylosanthes scabra TaxID=79078 RepID=A0ABU6XFH7_9FABA|nr:hypothetical protein [Stylosanthes scabra]
MLWFVTTYSIAFVLTSRVGRAKTRPWRPPHALSRAAQRLLFDLASVGIPCCSAVFLLLFGPSPAVLLCQRPYHRLRLTMTIPMSPASSPETFARAVTRLLKIEETAAVDLISPSTVQIVPRQRSCSSLQTSSPQLDLRFLSTA